MVVYYSIVVLVALVVMVVLVTARARPRGLLVRFSTRLLVAFQLAVS